jgi:antitoxin (DNA-binding transcriptional repressor) of toxin-antitoxin stability system
MTQATIHQAKTHLSRLIRKAIDGEEVIIVNRDKPVARLEAITNSRTAGRIGGLKHWRKELGADFNNPKINRKIERDFYRVDRADPLFRK